MVRSAQWRDAAPHIQEWVSKRFEIADRSIWNYIDRQVTFRQVGINRANFLTELADKIPETRRVDWDDEIWWTHVSNRIFYLFHRASDKADRRKGERRPRCWAEWSGPIPLRPGENEEASSPSNVTLAEESAPPAPIPGGAWAQLRSHIRQVTDRFREHSA